MRKLKDAFLSAAAVILLCCVGGCSTILQEIVDTAVAEHADLLIAGDAQFVELEYMMVDQEYTGAADIRYRSSHLGDRAKREMLPVSKSFLANSGDELHLHCRLSDTSGVAQVRLLVEGKERRSYELTAENPSVWMNHRF